MKYVLNWTTFALTAVFALSVNASTLLAQAPDPNAQVEALPTRYAVAYGLVLLGIVLGITNVVRPGKRKGEKQKPQ